jgi:hypothetical protein
LALLALLALSVFALFSISGSLARAADIGALNTFQPNTPALASEVNDNVSDVRTAVNTKQDESSAAGLDLVTSSSSVILATSLTAVASVTVTVPASGFVKVDFDSQSFVNHVTGATKGWTAPATRRISTRRGSRCWRSKTSIGSTRSRESTPDRRS